MKICSKCKEQRSLADYHKDKRTKSGLKSECKFCHSEYKKLRYKKHPEIAQTEWLKREYGITFSEKQQMVSNQNGECAICKKEFKNSKDTCVDHCHSKGHVRAILCQKCNVMLGRAEDNIQTLQNAIQYLTTHNNN